MADRRAQSWHARAGAGTLPTLVDGGRSTSNEDVLTGFFKWLERHTETMDPTMIRLARSTGHRYLSDHKVAQLVDGYLNPIEGDPLAAPLLRGA